MATSTIKKIVTPAVNSILITKTNVNPSTLYGGSWTLIDKRFKDLTITDTTAVTKINVSSVDVFSVDLDGSKALIRLGVTTSAAISTSNVELCRFDLTKLGWNSQNAYETWFLAYSDGGNGFALMDFVSNDSYGSIKAYRSICKAKSTSTSIASGSTLYMNFEVPFTVGQMGDNFCDKFYWKRTA